MEGPDNRSSAVADVQEAVETSWPKRKKIIIFGTVALVILAIILLVTMPLKKKKLVPASPRKATIRITTDGFSPSSLTVKKGTQIVWRNDDAKPHRVAANPYPVAAGALDSGDIIPGGSYTTTADKLEAWQYHDETNPELNASITVQE